MAEQKERSSSTVGYIILAVCFGGILALASVVDVPETAAPEAEAAAEEPEPEPEPEPEVVPLDVGAGISNTQIQLINQGDEPWYDCDLVLNPGTFRSGYSQNIARIAPGDTMQGGLMAFTRGDERFNPMTHVVERVELSCGTPDGEGFWAGNNP